MQALTSCGYPERAAGTQRQFTVQGTAGFVSYSAYHLGQRFIAVNGLTFTSAAEQYQHPRFQEDTVCQWVVPRTQAGQKEEMAVILEGSAYAMVDPLPILLNRGPCAQIVVYCEFEGQCIRTSDAEK